MAIKLMRSDALDPQRASQGQARMLREAQAMARLSHPNVITVHDIGTYQGQVFIAMEFVEGGTLREWLKQQPRPWREILRMFTLAGRGLAAAERIANARNAAFQGGADARRQDRRQGS